MCLTHQLSFCSLLEIFVQLLREIWFEHIMAQRGFFCPKMRKIIHSVYLLLLFYIHLLIRLFLMTIFRNKLSL